MLLSLSASPVFSRIRQSLGAVAHSFRAASVPQIVALHAEAQRRGLVFHMHIEEQVELGKRPLTLSLSTFSLLLIHSLSSNIRARRPATCGSFDVADDLSLLCLRSPFLR